MSAPRPTSSAPCAGWPRDGLGILFVTSDLDEVMALSDRIAVMSNGQLTGMFDRAEATEAAIVAASALGHGPAAAHGEDAP